MIVWGENDAIFPAEGARTYLRDLPDAEIHLLNTGHFALEGNFALKGQLPSNTSGGMLSEANLVGWNVLAEGIRQIRGESTSQVDDAEVCIVAGQGGFHAAHSTLLLTKETR